MALHESNQSTNLFISRPFHIPSFKLVLHAFNHLDCDQFIFLLLPCVIEMTGIAEIRGFVFDVSILSLDTNDSCDNEQKFLGHYNNQRSLFLTQSRRIKTIMIYCDAAAVTHEALLAVAFACSPRVCVGFLPQSKVMQVWLTGNAKFPSGVNGCLSPCVRPVRNLWATYFYISISTIIKNFFSAKLMMQVV